MSRRTICVLLVLALAAVAAFATGPTVSLSSWDLGRTVHLVTANVSGGTPPYTYEWSVDGAAFVEGFQNRGIYCAIFDNLTGRVTDDNGLVSNIDTFYCP